MDQKAFLTTALTDEETAAMEAVMRALDGMPMQSAVDTVLTVASRIFGCIIADSCTGDARKIVDELVEDIASQMKFTIMHEVEEYSKMEKS